jgi:dipeptidyl aminopeptidase/acylaminoacyl peptidase
MVPADICRIRWVSDPQLSPDGRRVAYVVTVLDEKANKSRSQVYLATADGESWPLTAGTGRDTAPRWSPDGRRLVFLRDAGEERKPQLWLIPADGGEARQLTNEDGACSNPAWSPNGRRVAYNVRVEEPPPEKEEDGNPLPKVRVITTLRYKLNAEGFINDRRNNIFVIEAEAEGPEPRKGRRLTRGPYDHGPPVWSPDGTLIAFAGARHPSRDRDGASDVWVMPSDGGAPRRFTQTRGPVSEIAWSPDGREVAYLGHTDRRAGLAINHRLWVVPVGGGDPRCLTEGLDRHCGTGFRPAWSADGRRILFGVVAGGSSHVHAIEREGGAATLILGGERQVTAGTMAGGRLAFLTSDPTHPAEVFLASDDGSGERRLTRENDAWLSEVELSPPERLPVTSADGTALEAWVMRPAASTGRTAPYATLLNVHGGPHAVYGNVFFDEFQVQAGAGYAVVYGNPRGSQGYGEAFSNAIRGAWGGKDWEDVQAIADAAARLDFVDERRFGILGGSYGGYMTSWAVGQTERFAAACSERAVNNLYSMVGSSDIGWSFQTYEIGGRPYADPLRYLERSPIHYVSRIRTPLLIIHSENDLRCPMEQAEQLYVALKLLRRPVRFVRFPEENHELSRSGKPRHRLKRFACILDWFERHLRP